VAWTEYGDIFTNGVNDIVGQEFDASGQPIGNRVTIADDGWYAGNPEAAVTPDGDILVTWNQWGPRTLFEHGWDSSNQDVFARVLHMEASPSQFFEVPGWSKPTELPPDLLYHHHKDWML
jgi:hypothetical protein